MREINSFSPAISPESFTYTFQDPLKTTTPTPLMDFMVFAEILLVSSD